MNDSTEVKRLIVKCAGLLSKLRGVIQIYGDENEATGNHSHTMPVIEKPDRINQLFYNLCRGRALVAGRTQIQKSDLKPLIEITLDSAPPIRTKLVRKLIEYGGSMKTSQIEKELDCSKPTALKEMETLALLKIGRITKESRGMVGEPEKELHLLDEFEWFVSDECSEIRNSE